MTEQQYIDVTNRARINDSLRILGKFVSFDKEEEKELNKATAILYKLSDKLQSKIIIE